jgi:KaiC/GvpD/RAD55 family RecA-like ATPase
MKESKRIFERLLESDIKAELLTLFHNNPTLSNSAGALAKTIGRSVEEVQPELEDLSQLGILKKVEVFSFDLEKDKELQESESKRLELGEIADNKQEIMRVIPKFKTELDVLDKILPDGMPSVATVLVLSDPGSGEEALVAHFVSQQAKKGKSVVYITLDNFPENVRQIVQSQAARGNINWANLLFVDCYSKTVGVESSEARVADPENLSALNIAISDIMSKHSISLIVLDSFNTLIRKRNIRSAIEFLRVLVGRARQGKCLALVTMNRKAFPTVMVASAQDVVEGVIELKVDEGLGGIMRSMRILKMTGTKHVTTWTPYDISDEGNLIPPKDDKQATDKQTADKQTDRLA